MDYNKMIEQIGLEKLTEIIPFTREQISKALAAGDSSLNSLPLAKWDYASGYVWSNKTGTLVSRFTTKLDRVCRENGYDLTNSQSVCLLKEAARKWAEEVAA